MKKEASKVKQTTRQSNTAHPRQSYTFPKKNELPRVGLEPTTLYTLDRALYVYNFVYMCICVYVCMCICVYVCMCVCVYVYMSDL